MTRYKKDLGDWGEKTAAKLLSKKGYRVIERNFQCNRGEIDLVAVKKKILVFVEVKTRRDGNFGTGVSAITRTKKTRIVAAARQYIALHRMQDVQARFDVVALDPDDSAKNEILEDVIRLDEITRGRS